MENPEDKCIIYGVWDAKLSGTHKYSAFGYNEYIPKEDACKYKKVTTLNRTTRTQCNIS